MLVYATCITAGQSQKQYEMDRYQTLKSDTIKTMEINTQQLNESFQSEIDIDRIRRRERKAKMTEELLRLKSISMVIKLQAWWRGKSCRKKYIIIQKQKQAALQKEKELNAMTEYARLKVVAEAEEAASLNDVA